MVYYLIVFPFSTGLNHFINLWPFRLEIHLIRVPFIDFSLRGYEGTVFLCDVARKCPPFHMPNICCTAKSCVSPQAVSNDLQFPCVTSLLSGPGSTSPSDLLGFPRSSSASTGLSRLFSSHIFLCSHPNPCNRLIDRTDLLPSNRISLTYFPNC